MTYIAYQNKAGCVYVLPVHRRNVADLTRWLIKSAHPIEVLDAFEAANIQAAQTYAEKKFKGAQVIEEGLDLH